VGTGEITEVADTDKASGQHMLAKAAQELGSGESHDALLIAVSIVSPSEGHAMTIEAKQALIAAGHAMGIAAKIGLVLLLIVLLPDGAAFAQSLMVIPVNLQMAPEQRATCRDV
jgi:hypothetical protein